MKLEKVNKIERLDRTHLQVDDEEAPVVRRSGTSTGKTARKRMKKAEKARMEEAMRRDAAAAVREYQAVSGALGTTKKRKRRKDRDEDGGAEDAVDEPIILEVGESLTVEQLAEAMEVGTNEIILALMDENILANKNQILDMDMIRKLGEAHGFEIRAIIPEEVEVLAEDPDPPESLRPRAPVVTVMGHVDHGKTTLLDKVRKANVAAGEAGGITQHIAAYEVQLPEGRVVFLDTPGHEAFTQLRARGAQVTDVVVLVVAADDGVMPQTVEAINHARAANVPIVVAINKCDKPDAQPDRIRQELTRYDLMDEQWGGKTSMRNISAKNNIGIEELIELLVLESQMLELKANPDKRARGTVVEAEFARGLGPVAWVLVQGGTLRVGDFFLAGETFGRVRLLQNSRGENIEAAGPATPVVVTGFDSLPQAGDTFVVVEDERTAKIIAEKRGELNRQKQGGPVVHHMTLEDFHARMLAGEKRELNIVVKADVNGSVEVLRGSLAKVGNEEVHANVIHAGVGGINESDVLLASASDAVIIGFNVSASPKAQKLAEQEGVEIRTYRVIYELIDNVKAALEGMLSPDKKENITGHASVRAVFRSSQYGNIAGCYITDGEIHRGSFARLLRDSVVVYEGKISSLRRNKEDARVVLTDFECGIKLDNFEDIKEGDVIEAFKVESVAKLLD